VRVKGTGTPAASDEERCEVEEDEEADEEAGAEAETRYVSASGKADKRHEKGSRENPFRTIQEALKRVRSGSTIVVLPGEYEEFLRLDARDERDRITLRGEGSPRPKIVAPSEGKGSAVVQVLKGRWTLDHLDIDVDGEKLFGVHFDANRGSTLSDCEVHDGRAGAGVVLTDARDITLERNEIHDFVKRDGKELEDAHGVVVQGASRDIRIQSNDIFGNSGDAVQCQDGEEEPQDIDIGDNALHDNGENGVDIKSCVDVRVHDNRLFRIAYPNTKDFRDRLTDSAGEAVVVHRGARDILIEGNDISQAGRGISLGSDSSSVKGVVVQRNRIREIRGFPGKKQQRGGQGIRITDASEVVVLNNTLEDTDDYAMMLGADGKDVSKLTVKGNTVRTRKLVRLGDLDDNLPRLSMDENRYARGGRFTLDGSLRDSSDFKKWKKVLRASKLEQKSEQLR